MRYLLGLLILSSFALASDLASDLPSCLIVKHASTSRQFFVSGANWQYVAGEFPKDMKWKSNVTDRDIRKIKAKGGRVIVVKPDYGVTDLEAAKRECATPPESAVGK
jgi:hypothetical protein